MDIISARLRLLDLQIVDSDGLPIGRVDDVELGRGLSDDRQGSAAHEGGVRVVALACGQGGLGRRLGGTLGRQLQASAARLNRPDESRRHHPDGVTRLSPGLVEEVSSVLTLKCPMAQLPQVAGLERWLATHLIARLPGAGEAAARDPAPKATAITSADPFSEDPATADPVPETEEPVTGGLPLSRLLGAPVHASGGGPIGIARDVWLRRGDPSGDGPLGPVTGLVVGADGWRSRLAHAWGYTVQPRSGPALLRVMLASEASRARVVPVEDVLSWTDPLVVRGPLERHPTLSAQERS